jgi:hypothetical protein
MAKDNATRKQTTAMAFKNKLRHPQEVRAPHLGQLSVLGGKTLRLHLQ